MSLSPHNQPDESFLVNYLEHEEFFKGDEWFIHLRRLSAFASPWAALVMRFA
jgi:hypothetical protein